eukprot:14093-Heterococcus_DN1.PRE.1
MGSVVYGWLAWHWGNPIGYPLAAATVAFIGFTRVCACSRFIHQVVLSAFTGTVGLYWGVLLAEQIQHIHIKHHQLAAAVVLFAACGLLGLWIESNDSTLAGVPKDEFTRVLGGILTSAEANAGSVLTTSTKPVCSTMLMLQCELVDELQHHLLVHCDHCCSHMPCTMHTCGATTTTPLLLLLLLNTRHNTDPVHAGSSMPYAASARTEPGSDLEVEGMQSTNQNAADLRYAEQRRAEKRDSFYHLQRTMERRTEETRLIRERAEERKVTLAAAAPGNARYH